MKTHREVSLAFLDTCKGYAVEASPGKKAPLNWNPARNDEAYHKTTLASLRSPENQNNLGVHLFGSLTEVDVDSDNPHIKQALDLFLPASSHVWGRTSSPRSHRAYRLKTGGFARADHRFLMKIERYAKVEIRGGELSEGNYTLLPGSIHPSGERYKWDCPQDAQNSLSAVDFAVLASGVRKACAAADLAQFWLEGQRNDLTMALSGFFFRLLELAQDGEEGGYQIEKDEAFDFLDKLMTLAGDDRQDRYMRKKTFEKTWKKAEEGALVTAGKRLAEISGDPQLLTRLYALLSDNAAAGKIEEFTSRFVILKGPGLFVDLEAAQKGRDISAIAMGKQNFEISHGNWSYTNADGKIKSLPAMLARMPQATRIEGMLMRPGAPALVEEEGDKFANLWAGFKIPACDEPVSDEEIQRFLWYLRVVVCNGSAQAYEWVTAWLSDIFQNPGNKTGTALVLVGKQGTGKSFLHERILKPIIGDAHSIATNNIHDVASNFNAMYANKVLIACDEATSARQKGTFEKMKTLITDSTMRVEPKGKDAFTLENHARFLLTSNHEFDAIHLSEGASDRRYTVLKVSEQERSNLSYWKSFAQWLTPTRLSQIHKWFLQQSYERELIRRPLDTEAKRKLQRRTMEMFDRWLMHCVERGFPLSEETFKHLWYVAYERRLPERKDDMTAWPAFVSYDGLTADFENFRRRHDNNASPVDHSYFGTELQTRGLKPEGSVYRPQVKIMGDDFGGNSYMKRVKLHPFPSQEDVVSYLVENFNYVPSHDLNAPIEEEQENERLPETTEY